MKPDEIKNLAIECWANVSPHGQANFLDLEAYTAAVEAQLQARIMELECFVRGLVCPNCNGDGYFVTTEAGCCGNALSSGECCGNAIPVQTQNQCQWCDERNQVLLSESPSTWLSEHDKEVEARERERIIASHEFLQHEGAWLADSIRNMK